MANSQGSTSLSTTTTITSRCLCGARTVTTEIPTEKLPIEMHLCSCSNCRHLSGVLAITSVSSQHPVKINEPLTEYNPLSTADSCRWGFCPICGSYLVENNPIVSRIGLCGGAIIDAEKYLELKGSIFVASALDGGMAEWLLSEVPAWDITTEPDFPNGDWKPPKKPRTVKQPRKGEKLRCVCHCGGVKFLIERATNEDTKLQVPATKEANPQDRKPGKWWIKADGTKYAAGVCACTSCRLASGFDIQPWAFIPRTSIIISAKGDRLPSALREGHLGTLKRYVSSPGISRYFCQKCGATIFYIEDAKPDLVDVSVGIMRAESGARAEEWLEWRWGRISFSEDASYKSLIQKLERGLREWGTRTGKGYEGLEWEERPIVID